MATKLADVTVGADGTWSSGPHTLASGARTVTLRRKSDGAVLATRSFTVEAGGGVATFETDNDGWTPTLLVRSSVSPISGSYSMRYANAELANTAYAKIEKTITLTANQTLSLKFKMASAYGSASVYAARNGTGIGSSLEVAAGDSAIKTFSVAAGASGAAAIMVTFAVSPEGDGEGGFYPTDVAIWVDDISVT